MARNLLGGLGVLSLGLSAFLIVNTMNAIVAQQVWQIGVIKAVGGTFGRVVLTYLAMAAVYGLLATLLGVQCQNELYVRGDQWPFDRREGTFSGVDGIEYEH